MRHHHLLIHDTGDQGGQAGFESEAILFSFIYISIKKCLWCENPKYTFKLAKIICKGQFSDLLSWDWHRLILITNNLCVFAGCQIKWGLHLIRSQEPVVTPWHQPRLPSDGAEGREKCLILHCNQSYHCNRISLGGPGPVFVQDPALFTGLFTTDWCWESEIRGGGGDGGGDIVTERCPAWFPLDSWSWAACLPNHYPFSPWLCATGQSDHQLPRPPPSPAYSPLTTPRSHQTRLLSTLHLTWPGGHPPSHHHQGLVTNGGDRSQKVKVEKWQMSRKTSHNSTRVTSSSLILDVFM